MTCEFVEYIPERLARDTLYISVAYATAVHLCCCGCGNEVVTPFARSGWTLIFDGTISLTPSIGNWSFPCQSHYWIKNDRVVWSRRWSATEIATCRAAEQDANEHAPRPGKPWARAARLAWQRLRAMRSS